ncbi:MAG: MmgE/PrpD family protein [archaeon]|nr:MmgE/PrpD family protein [archaeon]
MITRKIAEFVCSTNYDDLPSTIVNCAKRGILDCLGVTIAGFTDKNSAAIREYVIEQGGKSESTILGTDTKVPCVNSALVNGYASHILDYDDTSFTMTGHPSVISYPPALAVGEVTNATGKDFITAYVLSCEVACRLADAFTDKQYSKGWHNTGTMGTFGATAAAGKLIGLDAEQMAHAFGIAASMCAGIKKNFGTSCKAYHVGQSCSNGVRAAILAKLGLTSSFEILEGKGGLADLLSGVLVSEKLDSLGAPFTIEEPGYSMKLYPSCAFTHSAIDAVLQLRREHNVLDRDVALVEVGTSYAAVDTLIYSYVENGFQGKFSMQFCIAAALTFGQVTISEFSDAICKNPRVLSLMKRVKLYPDPSISSKGYSDNGATVKITLNNGQTLKSYVARPQGDPSAPLTNSQLNEKYASCLNYVNASRLSKSTLESVMRLESLTSLRSFVKQFNFAG